ncbi:MAG TPA: hypothetical protein ENN03_10115 [bacterium]|nr:hypothetical protein [bacterium]
MKIKHDSIESKGGWREYFWVGFICLWAVSLRLFLMRYRFALCFDEVNYVKMAASVARESLSQGLHPYWPPLYPMLVGLMAKISFHPEAIARGVSVISGVAVLPVVYSFVRRYLNRSTAVLSLLLLGTFPALAYSDTAAHTESLYTLLTLSGVFLGWRALEQKSWWRAGAAGILFGCGYLLRPEGIGYAIVLCAVLGLLFIIDKGFRKRSIQMLVLVVTGFLMISAPYFLYLRNVTGQWTLSTKGRANQLGQAILINDLDRDGSVFGLLSEDNTQVLIDQIYHKGDFLKHEKIREAPIVSITPGLMAKKYAVNLHHLMQTDINQALTFFVFIFMVLGLFGEAWDRKRSLRELYLAAYFFFFWFIVIPLFFINQRYLLPLVPIALVWAAQGLMFWTRWMQETIEQAGFRKKNLIVSLMLGVALAGTFLPGLTRVMTKDMWSADYWSDPVEEKIAGLWLRDHTDSSPVVMSRYHTAGYYAGNYRIEQSVTLPETTVDRMLAYARHREVDFILINERYMDDHPGMVPLLNGDYPPDLVPVYQNTFPSGLKLVIFRLMDGEQEL